MDLAENSRTYRHDSHSVALLTACVLGLPGNVLVLAVYVRAMTTSTRLYMFALALADSAVCVCGIVLRIGVVGLVPTLVFRYITVLSVVFSMFLLVFVSIERLIAVKGPHSFSTDARRAKVALVGIAVAAVTYATVKTVARLKEYKQVDSVSKVCVLLICLLIMTTCYTLIAAALLKVKTSRLCINRVAVPNQSRLPEGGLSNVNARMKPISDVDGVVRAPVPGPSTVSTEAAYNDTSAASDITKPARRAVVHSVAANAQTKTYKNVVLLFIVTIVFLASWMPQWVLTVGFSVPDELRRIFILNSVVNPFIYGVASAMFREDVRQYYRQTRVKLLACCH